MRRQTSDIRRQTHISSFLAKREIFVIRGLAVNDWQFQTGNLLSTYLRASPHIYLRRSRHLHTSFLIWVELSSQIKEQHVPGANPEPRTIKKIKKPVDTIAQDVIVLYPSLMKRPRSKER